MSRAEPDYSDVLLSFDPGDSALAEAVRQRLGEAGLTVASPLSGLELREYPGRLRPTLDACRAYVAVLSRTFLASDTLLVEVGAAWAIRMPVFFLLDDVRSADVSGFLKQYPAFLLWKGFPKLVAAIRKLPERVPA